MIGRVLPKTLLPVAAVCVSVAPDPPLLNVSVAPPLPAKVYAWKLVVLSPTSKVPTVRDVVSIVTFRPPVISIVLKSAAPPASATPPGGTDVQFDVLLQLPLDVEIHVPSGSAGVGVGFGLPPLP